MQEHFKTKKGIELYGQVTILSGTIAPGSSTDTNNAQPGSIYFKTDGTVYTKTTAGTGTSMWAQVKTISLPYDIAFYIPTNPYTVSSIVAGFLSPRAMTITAGSTNIAKCSVSGTSASTTFILNLNVAQVATIVFAANSSTGVITFTNGSTISVATGDLLTLSTSTTVDSTIAGIGITFVGVSILP